MSRSRWALIGVLLSASSGAEPASTATSIWYRSSDGCPDGAAFLERLDQLGRSARMADAGDTIDFVVTLGSKDGGSFGRLERQTERGTVAIREVEAPACVEVADALALSLDLALDPGQADRAPPTAPPPPTAPVASEAAASQRTKGVPEAPPPRRSEPAQATSSSQLAPSAPSAANDEASREAASTPVAQVGAQGMLVTGIGDAPLLGAGIFGELPLGAVSSRLSLWGATRASTIDDSTLRLSLFAARLEGCVWPLGTSRLYFHPCVGADLGVVSARYAGPNGGNDMAAWVSPTLLGRGVWSVAERLSLVAQFGVYLPLFRYDVGEPGEDPLASTDPVGVHAGLGLGLAL